jgi:2-methylcitrate dehydratase PrpD
MSKHLHAGRAAASGILAADLAARGFTGARFILEGERGFFAATAPDANPERVTEGLKDSSLPLKICGVSIKPHASCRHTHPAIDATLALRPQINGQAVKRIEIDTYQAALDLCNNPDPRTPYAAKFSLHYCVASALQRGTAGLADFTPEAIVEPQVRALLPQITAKVTPDIEAYYPREWATRLRIVLANKTVLETIIRNPKGDPENALSRSQLETKFRQLATYGGQANRAESWLAWVRALAVEDTTVACP